MLFLCIISHLFPHGTTGGVYYKTQLLHLKELELEMVGTATIDDFGLYGGTVQNLAITTEGKFYTSTVIIGNPGFSFVSATVDIGGGIDGSAINPSLTILYNRKKYIQHQLVPSTLQGR